MENEFKKTEKIDRYLEGQLTPAEQLDFEKKIASDAALSQEVELIKATKNAVTHAGRAQLKNRLKQLEKEYETPVRRMVPFRWIAAAAAVLVLLVVGIWLSKMNNSPTFPEQIFADHFDIYRNPILIRSGENKEGNNWVAAVSAYAKGDFENAATSFQQSLNDSLTISYLAHFYRGISLLAQPQPDAAAAISELELVLQSDNDYRLQAMWYQALAYFKLGNNAEAQKVLQRLAAEGDYKEKEAQRLLGRGGG